MVGIHRSVLKLPLHAQLPALGMICSGGTMGGQRISFALVSNTASGAKPIFEYTIPAAKIVANAWTRVDIKFADLGFTSGVFNGYALSFQA
jgi:hypothetical protein